MTDICFLLHDSVADDQRQRGICWQIAERAFIPIGHRQIGDLVPRRENEPLVSALGRLPEGAPGRLADGRTGSFRVLDGKMNRGECFPRVVRPIFGEDSIQTGQTLRHTFDQAAFRNIHKQQEVLVEDLEAIFRNVHPHEDNFDAYGHKIRNLMILAATEVESSMTAILAANDTSPMSRFYTTRDYVKLRAPLRLDEYEVSLPHFPWLPPFSPFRTWSASRPTQTLPWYDAYNQVKHDRESNFRSATLVHSISAVAAVHILLVCQFGKWGTYNPYFKLQNEPLWPRGELYIPPEDDEDWVSANLVVQDS